MLLPTALHGFRFYFTPLTGVLFAFPSRYWFTIGQSVVFSLGGWSPYSDRTVSIPPLLDFTLWCVGYGAITFIARLSRLFTCIIKNGANPISLAATFGISVDFSSSGYLDVSSSPGLPPVAMYSQQDTCIARGFVPSIQRLLLPSAGFILSYYVFHRLLTAGIHRVRLVLNHTTRRVLSV